MTQNALRIDALDSPSKRYYPPLHRIRTLPTDNDYSATETRETVATQPTPEATQTVKNPSLSPPYAVESMRWVTNLNANIGGRFLLATVASVIFTAPIVATTVNPAAVWGTPVALVAGFALAASLVRPWRPRPPVHDRQLDVILAVPFISLAAWMLLWWPLIDERRTPTDAGIVTVVAFTAAVVLLVLGTRTAGQLSPALLPGLVALPSLATNGWLVLSAIAVSGWLMFRRSEHPTRAQQIHLPACERAWVTVVVLGSLTLTLSLVDLLR